MFSNTLADFKSNVYLYLTGYEMFPSCFLIKKHTENLKVHGEFSLPNKLEAWEDLEYLLDENRLSMLDSIKKKPEDITGESKQWVLQLNKCLVVKGRVHMFVDRPVAARVGLSEALYNNAIIPQKMIEERFNVHSDGLCDDEHCLTSLRLKYLYRVIQHMYSLNKDCRLKHPNVFLTSKSTSESCGAKRVLVGAVLNSKTGMKETNITASDFIKQRQNEMTLIAQHKYGLRVSTDSNWREFLCHLGESAVMFELLQTRPGNRVKINFECSEGSSKGAAFVLYNCARLETILKTFNERVQEGIYPPLPELDDTDLSLLTQEEEWKLIFNYIMSLPTLLASSVELSLTACVFRPHHICNFLSSMVKVFSQYYRRTRILLEPRRHLLPLIFARMHMIIILNDTLKTCLKILNIKSVSQM